MQGSRTKNFVSTVCLWRLLIGVLLVQPLGVPIAHAEEAVPIAVRQGFTFLGRGSVNDAIAMFRSAIRQYPGSIEAKLGMAIAYRRAGRDADAWQTYQQVLAQEPNNQLALRTVGILSGFRAEWQQRGIEALATLLTLHPNDLKARKSLAELAAAQGNSLEATQPFEQLQLQPTANGSADPSRRVRCSKSRKTASNNVAFSRSGSAIEAQQTAASPTTSRRR